VKVCIDAGHGGADVGALGPTGLKESDMSLDVCKRIQRLLQPHVDVVMTRDKDEFLTLTERAEICNKHGCSVFLSYHFNSAQSLLANGWEIFTTKRDNNSDKLATRIGEEHAVQFPSQYARNDWTDGDLDKEANFAVIRLANCASVLMEGEFIHTHMGEEFIKDEANRQKMAVAAANGICEYLGIDRNSTGTLTTEERLVRLEKFLGIA
jgi:N-acetylmuramoyl-L-alanine amidase